MRWRSGDQQALDALMPLVYKELRQIAHHYLRQERGNHTLQSTALVREPISVWPDRVRHNGKTAPTFSE